MVRAIISINALLWMALGCFCSYAAFMDRRDRFMIVVAVFGGLCLLNGGAAIFRWRLWRVSSRVAGGMMILYGLDVLLLGHGEDVGGTAPWLILVGGSLGLGVGSIVLPSCRGSSGAPSHPHAPPDGGPATPLRSSEASEGRPSVS
jgi:hypothetical protein